MNSQWEGPLRATDLHIGDVVDVPYDGEEPCSKTAEFVLNIVQDRIEFEHGRGVLIEPSNPAIFYRRHNHQTCTGCGRFCPSGTLDNGLCLDCDMIGKKIRVEWGKFGVELCLVDHVSKNGIVYASRWNKSKAKWTKPRALGVHKGRYFVNSFSE